MRKTEGILREAAGAVQEKFGSLTGDAGAQLAGTAQVLRGKAQRWSADASDIARDRVATNPLSALAGAAVIGFVLGAMWSFNRD